MSQSLSSRLIIISTLFLVGGFVAILMYTYHYRMDSQVNEKWVQHTVDVIDQITDIDNFIVTVTSSQRAAIIANNEEFENNYQNNKNELKNQILKLRDMTQDNDYQTGHINDLLLKSDQLIKILDETLERNRGKSRQELLLTDRQELSLIAEDIFEITDTMQGKETRLLDLRVQKLLGGQYKFILVILGGIIVIFALIILINAILMRLRAVNLKNLQEIEQTKFGLEFAMKASGEGMYDLEIKTNKIYYSKKFADILGFEQGEFGHDLESSSKLIHEDDVDAVFEKLDLFLRGALSEYSIEFRMYKKDGSLIWVNSRADILYSSTGEPLRLIGTIRNITANKVKEENLIDAIETTARESEAKSGFLAHMSHEIRTPLTAISGVAEILQKQSVSMNEKQQKLIKTLSTSAQSLKELINDILDFSKIEKGEVDIEYVYFPLSEMIAEIISIMSVSAREKNIHFKVVYDDVKNIEYLGDKIRIRQILINLVGNAIKFTDEGQVTLLIEKNDVEGEQTLDFTIQDTGIGIDESLSDNIFEEFQQGDKSISRRYGGTGLGLPISKQLSALMGGDIRFHSKKNIGSTFVLTLPMMDKYKEVLVNEDSEAQVKITDRLSAAIRGEQCALIVDDYDGNIVILTYLLEEIGLQYDVANNGEEALEKWKSKHYDIILMDIQMPVMDGLTATSLIREYEIENKFEATPVIGMTAHALVEDKQKCIDAGMSSYLSKPIDNQKLKETIYYYLSNHQKSSAVS